MAIDWKSINPLDGRQDKGFEELCAQLARSEIPADADFVRKGAPDAGVECFATMRDGAEWGWQAKYFDHMEASQWQQIDKSIKTALEKHPNLTRYFVCVPIDLPDARLSGQRSAREKWDEHVAGWMKLASERGKAVEFVYWGSHELLDRLQDPKHSGRLAFFFDVRVFGPSWFARHLDLAQTAAGPRYSPEISVEIPIARRLDAFQRPESLFDTQRSGARALATALRSFENARRSLDSAVDQQAIGVVSRIQDVLEALRAIRPQPAGPLPFRDISAKARDAGTAAETLFRHLGERTELVDVADAKGGGAEARVRGDRGSHERRGVLRQLIRQLQRTQTALEDAASDTATNLMLLHGAAGAGKTHLLCDLARKRFERGLPTVLLMGQRFTSRHEPWSQALEQLDLRELSVEKFIGALEASAQAAGARALLMVDAINEGEGRSIWPSHLEAFLAHARRSDWIGVVLSVRTSYMDTVVPKPVREQAVTIAHNGFAGREYDAARTFFTHYGIELPSSPLLTPEFRNPLFLKTLCQGLRDAGECRLPRGGTGITAVFKRHMEDVNRRLAETLDLDPRSSLVAKALQAVSGAMVDTGRSWLPRSEAKGLVDALRPMPDFSKSLYRGLVSEGILLEDEAPDYLDAGDESLVRFGYERFGDHIAARTLLDRHLDTSNPAGAFLGNGPLAFLGDEATYVSAGLLQALCIELPERVGKELVDLAPGARDRRGMGEAFRQSVLWRAPDALSADTRRALGELCTSEFDLQDTWELLLTTSTIPGHPFNARFLDEVLRRKTMPERDACWSVWLHQARGGEGAVDRLIDWASAIDDPAAIEEETLELCGIALSWMFTTPNRTLRDRATKALANIFSGNLSVAGKLVEHFANVDDPYLTERVYGAAYGAAMRSYDPTELGSLAGRVYRLTFEPGDPPPHILLRDYARGIVERALCVGAKVEFDAARARPPYRSRWPEIPTEAEIALLLADWSKGSHQSGDIEWSRNRIASSVMDGDFARYVIGTNSMATVWRAQRLGEAPASQTPASTGLLPEKFDLRLIQRYVLKRVFDLGWTVERFGEFDRFHAGDGLHGLARGDRMGKKYQWIAYHEALAYISDHFQYRPAFGMPEEDQEFEGAWQLDVRDFDPSCNVRSAVEAAERAEDTDAWWKPKAGEIWARPSKPDEWVKGNAEFPSFDGLALVVHPKDGGRWRCGQAHYTWKQPLEPDEDPTEVERRDVWLQCTGYLVRADEAPSLLEWAGGQDFWKRGMRQPPTVSEVFLGEHAWSPASRYFERPYFDDGGWATVADELPVKVLPIARRYLREAGCLDCSIEETVDLYLPNTYLVDGMGLRWQGNGAAFRNAQGKVLAEDPSASTPGPSALLFRADDLDQFLAREHLTLFWEVRGERRVLPPQSDFIACSRTFHRVELSGAFALLDGQPKGFLRPVAEDS